MGYHLCLCQHKSAAVSPQPKQLLPHRFWSATPAANLASWLRETGFAGNITETSVPQAFPDAHTCALGSPGETVVVSGWLYLLSEVLERMGTAPGGALGTGFQDRP